MQSTEMGDHLYGVLVGDGPTLKLALLNHHQPYSLNQT
jgi:hypothetical protein